MGKAQIPSRYRSGSQLSRTCFWWSCKSESCWCTMSIFTPSLKTLKKTGQNCSLKRIHLLKSYCSSAERCLLSRKSSAMPLQQHCGGLFHRLLTFSGQQWLKIFNRATESRHPSSIQGIVHPRGGKWRVRRKTLCIIWVNGYAPEYVIHIHFHHKCSRKTI